MLIKVLVPIGKYLISFISKLLIISKIILLSLFEMLLSVDLCHISTLSVCLIWSPSLLIGRLAHLWFHAQLCPVWVCSLCLRVCAGLRYASVRVSVCVRAESRLVAGLRRWLVSTFTQEGGPFVGSLWWPGSRPRLVLLPDSRERSNVSDRERQTGKRDGALRSCRCQVELKSCWQITATGAHHKDLLQHNLYKKWYRCIHNARFRK